MNTNHVTHCSSTSGSVGCFMKGFFIRLIYGLPAVPILLLVRPDFLGKEVAALLFGCGVYLTVCLAGGAYDAATRQSRSIDLRRPTGAEIVIGIVFGISILLVLWTL